MVVHKEVAYTAGVAVKSIVYSYDLDGKRTRKASNLGTQDYAYNANGQLATAGQNGYIYDADGRLIQVTKSGNTVTLGHDAYDHLTQVTSNGVTTQYRYDAEGNRVGEVGTNGAKNYLVAPNLGNGLASTDLVTDGSGNVVSDYVYGGSSIIARLDANSDPLYYLTDSMGSVIGLVDGAGNIQSRIVYDGFGNVESGDDGSNLGGDLRFQGQWLESESGLYYMRARDYDSQTGLFLSRDAVDVQEQGVEAFNPYQFAYNNPLVFSDPTGLFSIVEMNATIDIQNVLNSFRTYSVNAAKQKLTDTLYEAIGNAALNAISNFVPGTGIPTIFLKDAIDAGQWFESTLRKTTCEVFKFGTDQLFFEPGVTSTGGNAINPGFNCSVYQQSPAEAEIAIAANAAKSIGKYRIPDFIVTSPGNTPRRSKNNGKTLISGGPDPSWLIGDIKLSLKTMDNDYVKGKKKPQWNAITRYAGRNGNNVAGFITLFGEGDKRDYYIQRITKKALETIVAGRNGNLAIIALVTTIAPSAKSPFTKGK